MEKDKFASRYFVLFGDNGIAKLHKRDFMFAEIGFKQGSILATAKREHFEKHIFKSSCV